MSLAKKKWKTTTYTGLTLLVQCEPLESPKYTLCIRVICNFSSYNLEILKVTLVWYTPALKLPK